MPSASAGREDYMKLLTEIIARLRDMDPAVTRAAGFTLRYAQEEDRDPEACGAGRCRRAKAGGPVFP